MRVMALPVELLHDRFGDAADVGVGRSGRDDEEVGGIGQPPQVEYHQLTALQILDGVQRQAQRLGNPGRHRAPFRMSADPSLPRPRVEPGGGAVLDLIEDRPGARAHMGAEHAGREGDEAVPRAVGRDQRRPDPLGHLGRLGVHHAEPYRPRAAG